MKRHKVAVATAAAVVASAFAAGTLAPGAQAWGDKCPPGNHDKQYCEHHHHHHHHHRNPRNPWDPWGYISHRGLDGIRG
jgi:hypothetical protein